MSIKRGPDGRCVDCGRFICLEKHERPAPPVIGPRTDMAGELEQMHLDLEEIASRSVRKRG